MTIQEFFDKYNNQPNVGNTPQNRGECVGLVSLWMDNFNIPHVYGHAKDLYVNAPDDYFAKIANTPDAIVQEGDMVVWGAGYNGTFGHTGIAKGKATVDKFDCFEQNDPLGSKPHIKTYNYAYVIGWLRFKSVIIAQPIAQEPTQPIRQIIIDIYRAICGVEPSKNEIKARLDSQINTYDLVKDILVNDSRSIYVIKVTSLETEIDILDSRIKAITEELKECKNTPHNGPKTAPPLIIEYPSILIKFGEWLKKIFK